MDDPEPCLTCTLPDCDENDPRCRLRRVSRPSKWAAEIAQVGALQPGDQVSFGPMESHKADVLQSTLLYLAGLGRLPRIRTRRRRLDLDDAYHLLVWRAEPVPRRRWSKWGDAADACRALQPGQEQVFYMDTVSELDRLQKTLCSGRRKGRLPGIRTWRVNGERLELHVKRE